MMLKKSPQRIRLELWLLLSRKHGTYSQPKGSLVYRDPWVQLLPWCCCQLSWQCLWWTRWLSSSSLKQVKTHVLASNKTHFCHCFVERCQRTFAVRVLCGQNMFCGLLLSIKKHCCLHHINFQDVKQHLIHVGRPSFRIIFLHILRTHFNGITTTKPKFDHCQHVAHTHTVQQKVKQGVQLDRTVVWRQEVKKYFLLNSPMFLGIKLLVRGPKRHLNLPAGQMRWILHVCWFNHGNMSLNWWSFCWEFSAQHFLQCILECWNFGTVNHKIDWWIDSSRQLPKNENITQSRAQRGLQVPVQNSRNWQWWNTQHKTQSNKNKNNCQIIQLVSLCLVLEMRSIMSVQNCFPDIFPLQQKFYQKGSCSNSYYDWADKSNNI